MVNTIQVTSGPTSIYDNAMKVDSDAGLSAWASQLAFLRRARSVTWESVASTIGAQRSNLSSFATTRGQVRNISVAKIKEALFELGMLPDGTLAPGLHRWQIGQGEIEQMCALFTAMSFERGHIFELGTRYCAFVVVVAVNSVVFVNLPAGCVATVKGGLGSLGDRVRVIDMDRAGSGQIQALWMTKDDGAVEQGLRELTK